MTPTTDAIAAARRALALHVRRTPQVASDVLADVCGVPVELKLELLQRSGSFKARGAFNRMLALTGPERARGVIAVSAGNHAAALALAGRDLGVDVLVLMPRAASSAKVSATRTYGATVDLESATSSDAFERMRAISGDTGRVVVHPFDDPLVIAGAGTVGLEIAEDAPGADLVVVPVGGGGLVAGIALALEQTAPEARIVGVQSRATGTLPASLAAGAPRTVEMQPTIADALTPPAVGELTLAICRRRGVEAVLLDEDELAAGFRRLYAAGKIAAEVAGAAPVAAILAGRIYLTGVRRIVCVVSGGNVAPDVAARLLST